MRIVLALVAFDPTALNAFSQPKAILGNAIDWILVGVLVALTIRHAGVMARRSWTHFAVAAFIAASVIATFFAQDHRVALVGAAGRYLGLVAVAGDVLMYVAAVALVRTRRDLFWITMTAAGSGAVMVLYAVVQRAGLDPIVWPSGVTVSRSFATLGNPDVLAQAMATLIAAAAAVAIFGQRSRVVLGFAATIAALAGVGLWLSGGRAALIGIAFAGMIAAAQVLWRWERAARYRRAVAIAAIALTGTFVLAVVIIVAIGQGARVTASASARLEAQFGRGSIAGRLDIYRVALEEVRDHPLFGVGPDNYVVAFPRYRSSDPAILHESEAAQSSTHSWILKTLTDSGVAGLVTFMAVVLLSGWTAFAGRDRTAAVAAVVLAAALSGGVFYVDHVAISWIPWLAMGLIAAPVVTDPVGVTAAARPGRRARPSNVRATFQSELTLAGVAVLVVTTIFAAMSWRVLDASHSAQYARSAVVTRATASATVAAAAQKAADLDPDSAENWNLLGSVRAQRSELAPAAAAFRRASEIAPYDFQYLVNLTRVEVDLAARDARARDDAVKAAEAAAALDPNVATVQYNLALGLYVGGRYAEAARASERAHDLFSVPTDRTAYEAAAGSYLKLNDFRNAEKWIRAGLPYFGDRAPQWRITLARILARDGRTDEALAELNVVLTNDPKNAEALQLRAELSVQ